MSRFVLSRNIVTVISTASIIAGSILVSCPQASYADASWADLLKPLVKDVIVPGASMGMKKLIERNAKKHGTSDSSSSASESSTSTSSDTSWQDSFATPQEPITSSAGNNEDDISPTPEEPMSASEHQYTSSAMDPASAPPPPVATP